MAEENITVVSKLFKWYEGMNPLEYTPVTGTNLNRNPLILAKAIDELTDKVGEGGSGTAVNLTDNPDLNDPSLAASSVATWELAQRIKDFKGFEETDESASGEIPLDPKIPVTYIGDSGVYYLGKPREWVKITTEMGEGLIPVFDIGSIIDNRG